MKIALVGKFGKFHDEEYIAKSFELLGHDVIRIPQNMLGDLVHRRIIQSRPDVLLFTKYEFPREVKTAIERSKEWGMKTVCWLFDLYWDYEREGRIAQASYFRADYVFTTDDGHGTKWKEAGINHFCVRQGISPKEAVLLPLNNPQGVAFVGSENPFYPERTELIRRLEKEVALKWYGRIDTDAVRGMDLNRLYAKTKIIVGDSVPSPRYWSNRIVETLGRGGFLIHREVEGLREEYPDLVTYGTYEDLRAKIDYYLTHEDERQEIVRKNFEWVRDNYTMDKKCAELISKL